MKFTAKQYAQALVQSLEESRLADQERILDNFVKVLVENNALHLFDEIEQEFNKFKLEEKGLTLAQSQSRQKLNRGNEKKIVDKLNDLVAGRIKLEQKIDQNLIGGVVVRLDDRIIDISIEGKLKQLKQDLAN